MLVGLIQPDAGSVWVGEQDVTALPMYRRARLGISYLPQEPSVFRRLTVEENLFGVLELLGVAWQEASARVTKLLEEFGLEKLRTSGPTRSRAANGAASRSPARWSPSRASCSWTSRSPASTRSPCWTSSGSSGTSGTGATAS